MAKRPLEVKEQESSESNNTNGSNHGISRPSRSLAARKRQILTISSFNDDYVGLSHAGKPKNTLPDLKKSGHPPPEWACIPQRTVLKLLQADPVERDINVLITNVSVDPAGRDICDVKLPAQHLAGVPCCFLRKESNEQNSCQECSQCEQALEFIESRKDKLYLCDNCTGACCGRCLQEADIPIPADDLRRDPKTGLILPGAPVLCKVTKNKKNMTEMEVIRSWRFKDAPKDVKDKLSSRCPNTEFLEEDEISEVQLRHAKQQSSTKYLVSIQMGEIKVDWESWECPDCIEETKECEEKEREGKKQMEEEENGYLVSQGIVQKGPYFSIDSTGTTLEKVSRERLQSRMTFYKGKFITMAEQAELSRKLRHNTRRDDVNVSGTPPWVVIEAFAGSGGGKEAASRAGLNVQAVLVIEQDDDCCKVLEERYIAEKIYYEIVYDMLDFEANFYKIMDKFITNVNKHFETLSIRNTVEGSKKSVPYAVDSSRVLYIAGSPCQNFAMVNANAAGIFSMGGRLWSSTSIVKAQLQQLFPDMVAIFENVAHMLETTRSHLISQAGMPCYFLDGADFGIARRSRMYLCNVLLHNLEPYQWAAFHPEDFVQLSSPGATCAYLKANTVMATSPNGKGVNKGYIVNVTDADDSNDVAGYLNLSKSGVMRTLNIKELSAANAMPRDFLEVKCNEDIVDATPISEKSQGKIFGNSFNISLTAHLLQDVALSEGITWGGFLFQGKNSGSDWWTSHGVSTETLLQRRNKALDLAKLPLPKEHRATNGKSKKSAI